MQNKVPHINLFSASGCLTAYGIKLYLNTELIELQKQEIESHLNTCSFCRDAVEGYQSGNNSELLNHSLPLLRKSIKKRYFSTQLTVPERKKLPKLQQHRAFYYLMLVAPVVALVVVFQFLKVQEVKEAKRFGLQFMEDSLFEPLPVILPNDSHNRAAEDAISGIAELPQASLVSQKAIALLNENEKVALTEFTIEVLFLKDGIVVMTPFELKNSSAKKIFKEIQKHTFWTNELKLDTKVGKKYYVFVKK